MCEWQMQLLQHSGLILGRTECDKIELFEQFKLGGLEKVAVTEAEVESIRPLDPSGRTKSI
jgi:hypothetical protein